MLTNGKFIPCNCFTAPPCQREMCLGDVTHQFKHPVCILCTTPSTCTCRSFTDIAFVDFTDTSRDWATNGIVSAAEYAALLGRPPQSLNDFKYSCTRLLAAGKLPMTEAECEQRRKAFGQSLKVIR